MQTKLARGVAKGFKLLRPSEAKAFALAVPPGFYSAVAGLAALFPDDPAESGEAPTLPTKRIGKAAPAIPTKRITAMKKAAQSKKTTAKKAAQSKKRSRR